jgi:hypothetical protein
LADVIKYDFKKTDRDEKKALQILSEMAPGDVLDIVSHIMARVMFDVNQGLDGEIGYKDSAFFEAIDTIYQEHKLKGCYMCDETIDANEMAFNYPFTPVCMSCQLKVANILKSVGINPQSLFPGIGPRRIQPVLFHQTAKLIEPSEN